MLLQEQMSLLHDARPRRQSLPNFTARGIGSRVGFLFPDEP